MVIVALSATLSMRNIIEVWQQVYFTQLKSDEQCFELNGHGRYFPLQKACGSGVEGAEGSRTFVPEYGLSVSI